MAKTLLNTPCNSEAKKENINTFDSIKCKTVPIACKIHPNETKKTTSNLSLKTNFWKYLFHDQLKSIKPNKKMIWVCEQENQKKYKSLIYPMKDGLLIISECRLKQ